MEFICFGVNSNEAISSQLSAVSQIGLEVWS